jgi:ubiquinone/menaquinone biosynthesis C-methylase UbiE
MMDSEKQKVHDFWDRASCGEELYLTGSDKVGYEKHSVARYVLEGELIFPFARFSETKGLGVLEIGVGLGADHQMFAEAGARLHGIDLSRRAIDLTKRRFSNFNLVSKLSIGDAESLNFPDDFFDLVYSWGVLHHSPNTQKAISEVFRVIKPGGEARIMIYHKWSMVGFMLWVRYALLNFKPWVSLREIYSQHLESPGTKAFSVTEARQLFSDFTNVKIETPLGHADLMESNVGQRHRGIVLKTAKKLWTRRFIRRFFPSSGIFMLIEARK